MASAFRLEGSSMLPVFKPGEFVLVSKERLKAGDCAVYSYKGRVLLHRVLKTAPPGAWFSDDAGRLEPHLVPWGDIKGRALGSHPLSGGFLGLAYSRLRSVWRLNLQRRFNLRS